MTNTCCVRSLALAWTSSAFSRSLDFQFVKWVQSLSEATFRFFISLLFQKIINRFFDKYFVCSLPFSNANLSWPRWDIASAAKGLSISLIDTESLSSLIAGHALITIFCFGNATSFKRSPKSHFLILVLLRFSLVLVLKLL